MKGSIKILIPYFKKQKGKLVLLCICMMVTNFAGLAIPGLIGKAIDGISVGDSKVIDKMVITLGMAFLTYIAAFLQNYFSVRVGQQIISELRVDVFAKIETLPVSFFDRTSKGTLIGIVITHIGNLSDAIATDLIMLITGCITMVGALMAMISISPLLTVVFLTVIPLMVFSTNKISKAARKLHRERKTSFGRLCGYTEEMITAQKSVTLYGQEKETVQKFDALAEEQKSFGVKSELCSGLMMPVMNGLHNLSFALICGTGAFLASQGKISIGNISSFLLYSKKFAGPVSDASNIIGMLQASVAACDIIEGILEETPEETIQKQNVVEKKNSVVQRETVPFKATGDIEFSHVSFAYNEKNPVLQDMSFHIRSGQKVAIVGTSGAGKTTLISLMLNFYQPTKGEILFNGQDIRNIPLKELRDSFAMVLQEGWLFEGTIYDNLAYALPEDKRDRKKILDMCSKLGVDEIIQQIPGGYDYVLKENASSLSQGQKQLINVIRAFLCNPAIFILDEATSSVDPQTEHRIQQVTDRVLEGKTSIVIAHRLSTILTADCIMVLDHGSVAELGTHDELMEQNGIYRQIYESQFA